MFSDVKSTSTHTKERRSEQPHCTDTVMPEQTTETNESDRCRYIHSAVWRDDLKFFNVCTFLDVKNTSTCTKERRSEQPNCTEAQQCLNKQPKQTNLTDASASFLLFGEMVLNNFFKIFNKNICPSQFCDSTFSLSL